MTDAIGLFLVALVILCCAALWSKVAFWIAIYLMVPGLWLICRAWYKASQ